MSRILNFILVFRSWWWGLLASISAGHKYCTSYRIGSPTTIGVDCMVLI